MKAALARRAELKQITTDKGKEYMNKLKLFLENFLVYGLGGTISKIIPFIMVPIVTRLMPDTAYFGLSDMSQTIVSLASALAVMGMYDAMYRMFFDREDEEFKRTVCSTTMMFTLGTSVVVFIILLLCRKWIAAFFFENAKYAYLVYFSAIATLCGATNTIVSAPTRMQNKRKVFLVANTVGPVISYGVAIPLLLKGYYVIALPLSVCVSQMSLELAFGVMNRKWFSAKRFDARLLKDLLKIGLPLMPNFLVYWIFNSSDRVMITRLIGIGESGVYSVGAKLGMASQLIYTAFAGGWQFFAFSTMGEKDQVGNNSKVFEYLGCISFVATLFICAISRPLFDLLFPEVYHRAAVISPYLFLAPLLQMLFQVACNQFLVVKKTWPNLIILATGAIMNVILNFALIPRLGIEGASIATAIGYVISDIICVAVLKKMKLIRLSGSFLAAVALFVAGFLCWRFVLVGSPLGMAFAALGYTLVVAMLYRRELAFLFNALTRGARAKDGGQ